MRDLVRRYDLGGGWSAEDNGYTIRLHKGNRSMGCARWREEWQDRAALKVQESRDGGTYYLPGVVSVLGMGGFWLSTAVFETKEAAEAASPKGIDGPITAWFKEAAGSQYWRYVLMFSTWDVKEKREETAGFDPVAVADFADLVLVRWDESAADADKFLEGSGWDFRTLLKIIGPWVPIEEIPVVVLTPPVVDGVGVAEAEGVGV